MGGGVVGSNPHNWNLWLFVELHVLLLHMHFFFFNIKSGFFASVLRLQLFSVFKL